ncbi:multicopper oxidase family protein [Streptomyces sp. NPDC001889]
MFETLLNVDVQFALLNLLLWTAAALVVGRAPVERSPRRTRARAVTLLVLLGLGILAVAGRIVTVTLMGRVSWLFASDRVAVALPLLAVPAAAALVGTVPRLIHWARRPSLQARRAAFTPFAVVPPHLAAAGAAAGFSTTLIQVVPEPAPLQVLGVHTTAAVLAAAGWLWQTRRWRAAVSGAPARRPRRRVRALRALAVAVALALAGGGLLTAGERASRLPDDMDMAAHHSGGHDHGGSGPAGGPVSVSSLTGPRGERPDRRFTLVADEKTVTLASGGKVEAWAFNGQIPGPVLRIREGELVEIVVRNRLEKSGVSAHWHGVDVPNAEDGVPGVTQDAVEPGGSHVYRFRPDEVGTHWYHSHQQTSVQVLKGLFGALIIEPREPAPEADHDWFLAMHTWDRAGGGTAPALGLSDRLERRRVAPGSTVRLRLLNSGRITHRFSLTGTAFTVEAVDGNPVNGPTPVRDESLVIGVGGRYDVTFTMPDRPVRLTEVQDFAGALDRGLLLSADGRGELSPDIPGRDFDPVGYGSPAPAPFGPESTFDRDESMVFDNEIGFYDGRLTATWSINGKVFPDIPAITVREGDLVRMTFANRSRYDHPMHLHGHHVLVLSRNGRPVTGSPLWLDTVNVEVGEVWEVAFRADNPGIWMDHCHISDHVKLGMMLHVSYEGVTSPYRVGRESGNIVE